MRRLVPLVAVAVLGTACARLSGGPGGTTGSSGAGAIEHPTGPRDLVLGIDTAGGFLAPQATLTQMPSFSLFGDGTLITQGAQIEIYPGPALPPLIETHVTEDGIQSILRAAQDARLLGPDATYGLDCVADAGTTTFTVNAHGSTHMTSVYALGAEGGCGEDTAKRRDLEAFDRKLGDLRSWLPEGSVGPDGEYRFSDVRIYVLPYQGDPSITEPPIDWPLSSSLASFGAPVGAIPGARCGVVDGDDLSMLMPHVRDANQLTPWRSGGDDYTLLFRPLLPDEQGC